MYLISPHSNGNRLLNAYLHQQVPGVYNTSSLYQWVNSILFFFNINLFSFSKAVAHTVILSSQPMNHSITPKPMQSKARDCLAQWRCWIKHHVAPELCEDSEEETTAKDEALLRHKGETEWMVSPSGPSWPPPGLTYPVAPAHCLLLVHLLKSRYK